VKERAWSVALLLLARVVRALHAYPRLEVNTYSVPVQNLDPALDGFTIVQVSDLHVGPGPWLPPRWEEAAAVVRAGEADLVVNTGDFLQWEPPPEKARRVFERFLPGSGRGDDPALAVAILGNHDYIAGEEAVCALTRELRTEGVHVLTNEVMSVRHGNSTVTLVGLAAERPGVDKAIEALTRAPRPRIVLVHRPDEAVALPAGSADLVLAGHTHGGQVALPGVRAFTVRHFCKSQFVEGWYAVSGNRLYVNRGLGCTGYPVRFRSRPEVSIFRLTRAEVQQDRIQLTGPSSGVARSAMPDSRGRRNGAIPVRCGEPPPQPGDPVCRSLPSRRQP
jgi:uncharacterized protein